MVELELLSGAGAVPSPYSSTWLSLDGLATLGKALETKETQWICPHTRMSSVLRTSCLGRRDTTIWTAFAVAAQSAATMVGFHRTIAAQLAATIDELCSNIFEHSESPDTGSDRLSRAAEKIRFCRRGPRDRRTQEPAQCGRVCWT